MPPAKREVATEVDTPFFVGQLINVSVGGRTISGCEVLAVYRDFIKLKWDMTLAPQTETVVIPYAALEAIGLPGER
jgi:hypothetical protein